MGGWEDRDRLTSSSAWRLALCFALYSSMREETVCPSSIIWFSEPPLKRWVGACGFGGGWVGGWISDSLAATTPTHAQTRACTEAHTRPSKPLTRLLLVIVLCAQGTRGGGGTVRKAWTWVEARPAKATARRKAAAAPCLLLPSCVVFMLACVSVCLCVCVGVCGWVGGVESDVRFERGAGGRRGGGGEAGKRRYTGGERERARRRRRRRERVGCGLGL